MTDPQEVIDLVEEELRELEEARPTWWKAVKGGFGWAAATLALIGGVVWVTGHDPDNLPHALSVGWPVLWVAAIPFSYWLQKRRFEHVWRSQLMRRLDGSESPGVRAAFKVETYRAAAEQLRQDDPEMYLRILAGAEGEAASVAASYPDAFVALFLAEVEAGLAEAEAEGVTG
jgi:hypothetical protein